MSTDRVGDCLREDEVEQECSYDEGAKENPAPVGSPRTIPIIGVTATVGAIIATAERELC